ncbi:MAG: hypothetical protein WC663_00975 [Patescibacteria group bacterium]|jgi:hypothetical protein
MFKKSYIILALTLIALATTAFGCKKADTNTNQPANQNANVVANNTNVVATNDNEFPIVNANEALNANENVTLNVNETENAVTENLNAIENQGEIKVEQDQEKTVLALASKIAEIYGTFTNKDKEAYKNLKTIKTYSTEKMSAFLDEQIAKPIDPKASFYGVTTKTISSGISDTTDKEMTAIVTTKREEITAQNNKPTVKYQILKLEFTKVGEEWKLSGAFWL